MKLCKNGFVLFFILFGVLHNESIFCFGKTESNANIVADWKFNKSAVKSGSIDGGNLVLKDFSGNGNDLKMQLYKAGQLTNDIKNVATEKRIKFSDRTMLGGGSIEFQGGKHADGMDFITSNNATINKEEFRDGYTIEVIYYLPADWTQNDKWMGLLARQAKLGSFPKTMDEPELGSMSLAVSNCKEIQFLTANADDNHEMESSAWGISMDKGGTWYHIVVTCDGRNIKTFVNGAESFRNYSDKPMVGMFADKNDGRFRVGSSYWLEGSETLDKIVKGNIERVRISREVLPKKAWLVPQPEKLIVNYGTNDNYSLKANNNYNFVFIPDTQNTVKFVPDCLKRAVEGTLKNAGVRNIKAVFHLGDIVEDYDSEKQFKTASEVFALLSNSNIPFLPTPGNHDTPAGGHSGSGFGIPCTDIYYAKNFAYSTENMTSVSPSGRSAAKLVKAGSFEYLLVSYAFTNFSDANEKIWLKKLLETYRDKPTIIASHILINCSDTEPSKTKLDDNYGNAMLEIVKDFNQVIMLVGGHYHGAGWNKIKNAQGKEIVTVLADYQFAYKGGNGFFKYAEFDEAKNKIFLRTFSDASASLPKAEKTFFDVNFLTGTGNDDVIDFDFTNLKERLK